MGTPLTLKYTSSSLQTNHWTALHVLDWSNLPFMSTEYKPQTHDALSKATPIIRLKHRLKQSFLVRFGKQKAHITKQRCCWMNSTLLLTSSAIFSTSAALFAWYGIWASEQTVKILSHHLFRAQNSERNLCELLPHKWIWRTNIKQTSVIITAERLVRWSSCSIWAFPRTVNRPWPVRYASNILPSRNSYDTHHKMSHLKPLSGPSSDPSYKEPTISWAFPPFPVTIES